MAKYINRQEILNGNICKDIECKECSFAGDDGTCGLCARVLGLPVVDAIERSKIDEALEEIEEYKAFQESLAGSAKDGIRALKYMQGSLVCAMVKYIIKNHIVERTRDSNEGDGR